MMMMTVSDRKLVHLDLDSFFVSAERLRNSQFIGKPLIIGGSSDRGVVASCSYESRKFGVKSAMPMRMAKYLCPDAIVVKGDMEFYSQKSAEVTEVIASKAPVFEKASIDEHYLDITGMDRFFGCYKWTQELRQTIIKETGLPISFGLSVNKTVSKIATGQVKPNGEVQILQAGVKPFIDPLSIQRIPGLGEKSFLKLRFMGLSIIQELAEMPVEAMQKVLGENGKTIWLKANGIDNSPVEPYSEQKSISKETTFEKDTTDIQYLNEVLVGLVEKICFQLRKQNKVASCITVKIRYSNFDTQTQQITIPFTSYDHTLIKKAKELFEKLYDRRMLIRLIGVRLTKMVHGSQQINLFEDTPQQIRLYQAMDKMKNRYGIDAIKRAVRG